MPFAIARVLSRRVLAAMPAVALLALLTHEARADTETLPPDAVVSSAGFRPFAGGDVDESPDAPDGSWAVAADNNTSGEMVLSFGSPSASLSNGASLQTFRAWVRRFDAGQSGTPTVRLEVYEAGNAGNPLAVGSDISVTGSGQMLTLSWNANLLADGSGADVQARIVTTKSGGSPGARNSVDIGAVEWVADYVATPPGWAKKLSGVVPAAIQGIPVANIQKVNGL